MNIPFIEFLSKPLRSELPHHNTLDEYIDYILPKIMPYGEDLYEEEYYTEKPWREVNDRDDELDVILHILDPHGIVDISSSKGSNYILSTDGDITKGNWGRLEQESSNIITFKTTEKYELFEKLFINDDFFILKKHGDKHKEGSPKYLVMGKESAVKNLEWREVVELLYDIYRYRTQFIMTIIFVIIILLIVFMLSYY